MRKHIRCVGVPEHFNLPWHLAIESGTFEQNGITVLWNDEPKGTGAMCQALREGSTDLAVMVTTGTIRECLRNQDIQILGCYVESPLIWGVHVPAQCRITDTGRITTPRFAISRFNSGSHLMAYYMASQYNWILNEADFEVVHDLNGCRKVFESGPELLFLWEKFTTSFLVDLGEFRRIGEVTPPWPCFLIAARRSVLETDLHSIKTVLKLVCEQAQALQHDPKAIEMVAHRYNLPLERAASWFRTVRWSPHGALNRQALLSAMRSLKEVGMISVASEAMLDSICWEY